MIAGSLHSNLSKHRIDQLGGHVYQVSTLDWNCTGDYLATGSTDPTVILYKVHPSSGLTPSVDKSYQKLPGVASSNFFVVWHPSDPNKLASLDEQGIRIWDSRSSKITTSLPTKNSKKLLYAVWAPNGNELVVTTSSNVNMIVDVRKEAIVKNLPNDIEVNQAAVSPDGRCVLQGLGTGHIAVCDYPSFEAKTTLAGHMERVVTCKFDPSGRYFVTGSHDSTVTVWEYDTLMPVCCHYNYDSAINDASFSHDSQLIAMGGKEHTVKINHASTGEMVHRIDCPNLAAAVCWNPKHMLLAYTGQAMPADRGGHAHAHVNVFVPI